MTDTKRFGVFSKVYPSDGNEYEIIIRSPIVTFDELPQALNFIENEACSLYHGDVVELAVKLTESRWVVLGDYHLETDFS